MKKNFLKNNKGVSLIELLVAIAILSVIMVPLLNSFYTSSRIIRNSQLDERERNITQTIAERIDFVDMDAIIDNTAKLWIDDTSSSTISDELGIKYTDGSYDKNSDKYVISLTDVVYLEQKYSAEIELDAGNYDSLNDIELTSMARMDALFQQDKSSDPNSKDPDARSLGEIENLAKQELTNGTTGDEPVLEDSDRRINIVLAGINKGKDADGVNDIYSVTGRVEYLYEYTYKYENAANPGVILTKKYSYKDDIPACSITSQLFVTPYETKGGVFPSIYFLYHPKYKDGVGIDETITIDNTDPGMPVNVFIIKQTPPSIPSDYVSMEATYDLVIDLKQNRINTEEQFAKVYTNAGVNLANPSATPVPVDVRIIRSGGYIPDSLENDIVVRTAKNRLYDVKIELFNAEGELVDTLISKKG